MYYIEYNKTIVDNHTRSSDSDSITGSDSQFTETDASHSSSRYSRMNETSGIHFEDRNDASSPVLHASSESSGRHYPRAPDSPQLYPFRGEPTAEIDTVTFLKAFLPLTRKTPEALLACAEQWVIADSNSEGQLSLSAVESWVQQRLCDHVGTRQNGIHLYRTFLPIFGQAFHASRNLPDGNHTDFVNLDEFRLLIAFLCFYSWAFDAFRKLDSPQDEEVTTTGGVNDWTVSQRQWLNGYRFVTNHGFVAFPLSTVDGAHEQVSEDGLLDIFYRIDTNHDGYIHLTQWCEYLRLCECEASSDMGLFLSESLTSPSDLGDEDRSFLDAFATDFSKLSDVMGQDPLPSLATGSSEPLLLSQGTGHFSETSSAVSLQPTFAGTAASDDVKMFLTLVLPLTSDEEVLEEEWEIMNFDTRITLADGIQWIENCLMRSVASPDRAYSLLHKLLPAFTEAFHATSSTDQTLDRYDFPRFLVHACIFSLALDAFGSGRTSETRLMPLSRDEFLNVIPSLKDYGFVAVSYSDHAYNLLDSISDGDVVSFTAWCNCLTRSEVDGQTEMGKLLLGSSEQSHDEDDEPNVEICHASFEPQARSKTSPGREKIEAELAALRARRLTNESREKLENGTWLRDVKSAALTQHNTDPSLYPSYIQAGGSILSAEKIEDLLRRNRSKLRYRDDVRDMKRSPQNAIFQRCEEPSKTSSCDEQTKANLLSKLDECEERKKELPGNTEYFRRDETRVSDILSRPESGGGQSHDSAQVTKSIILGIPDGDSPQGSSWSLDQQNLSRFANEFLGVILPLSMNGEISMVDQLNLFPEDQSSTRQTIDRFQSWIRRRLIQALGGRKGIFLYSLYLPCYQVALQYPVGSVGQTFRRTIARLCMHVIAFDAFLTLKTTTVFSNPSRGLSEAHTLSKNEWMANYQNIKEHCFYELANMTNECSTDDCASAFFDRIDVRLNGSIEADEWCLHLVTSELSARTRIGVLIEENIDGIVTAFLAARGTGGMVNLSSINSIWGCFNIDTELDSEREGSSSLPQALRTVPPENITNASRGRLQPTSQTRSKNLLCENIVGMREPVISLDRETLPHDLSENIGLCEPEKNIQSHPMIFHSHSISTAVCTTVGADDIWCVPSRGIGKGRACEGVKVVAGHLVSVALFYLVLRGAENHFLK